MKRKSNWILKDLLKHNDNICGNDQKRERKRLQLMKGPLNEMNEDEFEVKSAKKPMSRINKYSGAKVKEGKKLNPKLIGIMKSQRKEG